MLKKGGDIGGKWDFPFRLREKIRCDPQRFTGSWRTCGCSEDPGGISANCRDCKRDTSAAEQFCWLIVRARMMRRRETQCPMSGPTSARRIEQPPAIKSRIGADFRANHPLSQEQFGSSLSD